MKFVAIGRTRILLRSIRELVEVGHSPELVITCDPEEFYRASAGDFERLANDLDCDYIRTPNLNDGSVRSRLEQVEATVGISVNWKTIIEPDVLKCFEHNIINYHAGDLPRYRGNAAMNWAIINGEDEVVHTLHKMSEELDAGSILAQRSMPLDDTTKIGDIYEFAENNVPDLFATVFRDIDSNDLEPESQPTDPDKILRCYPRKPKDSEIDWSSSATHIHRVVRASSEPLFGAYTFHGLEKLRVLEAHPEEPAYDWLATPGQVTEIRTRDGTVAVATGDGFLVLEEIEPEGGQRQAACEVITSHRTRLGLDMQNAIRTLLQRMDGLEESD